MTRRVARLTLRQARERKGLKQVDVAERAGISTSVISRLERGKRGIPTAVLLRLGDVLELSDGELVDIGRQLYGLPPRGIDQADWRATTDELLDEEPAA